MTVAMTGHPGRLKKSLNVLALFFILEILLYKRSIQPKIMNKKVLLPEACTAVVKTSFGSIGVVTQSEKIIAIHIFPGVFQEKMPGDAVSGEAVVQIRHYLRKPEMRLDLPVQMSGTEIHRKIWTELMAIPAGQVKTYGELGSLLHFSPRVICEACEANPLALYIPRHRVVAISGPNGPVGEGDPSHPLIQTKHWLLRHEGFLHV